MNTFYHGDCKLVMNHDIPPESVDLIYLDPPFFTGKVQKGKDKWNPRAMEISFDDTKTYWGQHQEEMRRKAPPWLNSIPRSDEFKAYLYYMMERLELCKRVLKPTGSIYLHCDWRASHYLKMSMDKVFEENNFQNEIIWHYFTASSKSKAHLARKHDTIFFYAKNKSYTFNLMEGKRRLGFKPVLPDVARRVKYGSDEAGYYSISVLDDVWEIGSVFNLKREFTGYPTQKPEALLERIIKISSNEGDTVLDPFCGCGTAVIVSHQLDRQWIGIDINKEAWNTLLKRTKQPSFYQWLNSFNEATFISRDLDDVLTMNGQEFEKWANQYYGATKPYPDKEVDGITKGGIPVQVKTTKNGTDSPEIHKFHSAILYHPKLQRDVREGIFVSQNGFTDRARQVAYEIEESEKIKIHLIIPEEMLK